MTTTANTINLGDFEQFKGVMNATVAKLKNFIPPEITVLDLRIAGEEQGIKRAEVERDDIQAKQTLAQSLGERAKYSPGSVQYNLWNNQIKPTLALINAGRTTKLTEESFLNGATPEARYREWTEKFKQAGNGIFAKKLRLAATRDKRNKVLDKWVKERKGFDKQVSDTEKQLRGLGASPTREQQQKLYDALKGLTREMPDPFYGKVLQGLYTNAMAQQYDREVKNIRGQLKTQLREKLGNPPKAGGKEAMKLKVDFGAGFGAILKVGVDLSNEFSCDVSVGDDGKLTFKNAYLASITPKASAGGDAGVVKLKGEINLKGSLQVSEARTFNNLDDFVDAETNRIGTAFLEYSTQYNPLPTKGLRNWLNTSKAIDLREKAFKEKRELAKNAKLLNLLSQDKDLDVPVIREIDYIKADSTTLSGSGEAKGEVKTGVFTGAISLSDELQRTWEVKSHRIPLLDNLKAHTALQEIAAIQKPRYFGFAIEEEGATRHYSGEGAVSRLQEFSEGIKEAKAAEAAADNEPEKEKFREARYLLREQIKGGLDNLRMEYESLVYLQNRIQAKDVAGDVKTVRDKIIEARGADNTAQYIKGVMHQYTAMRRAFDDAFVDSEQESYADETDGLDAFEEEMVHPPFHLDPNLAEKHLKINQISKGKKTALKSAASLELKGSDIAPGLGGTLKGAINHTAELDEKWQPKVEYAAISVEVGANVDLKKLISGIVDQGKSAGPLSGMDTTTIKNEIASAAEFSVTPNVTPGYKTKVELSLSRMEGEWRIKNARVYDERSLSVGGKLTVKDGQGELTVGGSFSTSHTRTRFEYLGDNTLLYLNDVYASQNPGGKDSTWNDYKNKNIDYFNRLFKNIKDPASGASRELQDWIGDLDDGDTAKTEFVDALDAFRNGTRIQAQLAAKFDSFMQKRLQKSRDDQFKKYVFRLETRTLKEYARTRISQGVKDFAKENNIPDAEARDVAAILKWTQKHYKQQSDETRLAVLKKAFALEYAKKTLDDYMESSVDKDKQTALDLMDGDFVGDAYKDPKVYLGKGVSGSLRAEKTDASTNLHLDATVSKGTEIEEAKLDDVMKKKVEGISANGLSSRKGRKEMDMEDGSRLDFSAGMENIDNEEYRKEVARRLKISKQERESRKKKKKQEEKRRRAKEKSQGK